MIFDEAFLRPLSRWENFYVIVGSTGGALTGLQFVVMSLIADGEASSSMHEIRAFGTPTVVHFCGALLISSILSAPWHGFLGVSFAMGIFGAGGVAYILRVIWHARQQQGYKPDVGDWLWYAASPLTLYLALLVVSFELNLHPETSLFIIAAITLALLFLGIHNAWDTVTFLAVRNQKSKKRHGA